MKPVAKVGAAIEARGIARQEEKEEEEEQGDEQGDKQEQEIEQEQETEREGKQEGKQEQEEEEGELPSQGLPLIPLARQGVTIIPSTYPEEDSSAAENNVRGLREAKRLAQAGVRMHQEVQVHSSPSIISSPVDLAQDLSPTPDTKPPAEGKIDPTRRARTLVQRFRHGNKIKRGEIRKLARDEGIHDLFQRFLSFPRV